MKTILALAILLLVAGAAAAGTSSFERNCLGLFYDQAATIDELDVPPNSQQVLYLVLINPVSASGEVRMVGGFECAIVPASGDYLLGVSFPLNAINLYDSVDNLVVGYAQGLQVGSGGGTTLATINVLVLGNNPEGYYLQPSSPASHPNNMMFVDLGGSEPLIVDALPISGSHDRPVFTFGDFTVEEDKKWGDVKSLYR